VGKVLLTWLTGPTSLGSLGYDRSVKSVVLSLFVVLSLSACTGSPTVETVLSPAPTECPGGIVRADNIPASELVEQMRGHVPAEFPTGFGLVAAWQEGDGMEGAAVWADEMCREVFIGLWPGDTSPRVGTKVGDWVVTAGEPGGCGNAVLGPARCLEYHARVDEGTVGLRMMGMDRVEGDVIVLSIPT